MGDWFFGCMELSSHIIKLKVAKLIFLFKTKTEMKITMKKTLLNTLFIGLLAFLGTSCNSAHELMEPTPYAVLAAKATPNAIAEVTQKINKAVSAKKTPADDNFITTLNKFLNIKYANMLGVLPQFITNDVLYSFIDEWYGTRYRYGGNSKTGIDCSAFVQRLYSRVFNVELLRTAAAQFSLCKSIWGKEELKEGDLVFFNIRSKNISHVGIYLANNYFVHSSVSSGVMISKLTDAYWQKYFSHAGRIPIDEMKKESNTLN